MLTWHFLDAPSEFDLISYKRILDELEYRNTPKHLIHIILAVTFNSDIKIRWFNNLSTSIMYPTKGVKQGGCLSSYLFSICYDKLVRSIRKSSSGVLLKTLKVQILIYADDIVLCSTSSNGLVNLYDKVMQFADSYSDIKMNLSKSAILRLGLKRRKAVSFYDIPAVEKTTYLGSIISSDTDHEILRATKSLYIRSNILLKQNNQIKYCNKHIRKTFLNTFGNVYGIETFNQVSSKMTNSHRYMAKILFPEYKSHLDINNIDITSRKLYKIVTCSTSLPEQHRIRLNNFIIKAKTSNNPFINKIVGSIKPISQQYNIVEWMKQIRI
jgi:hypothetical protein